MVVHALLSARSKVLRKDDATTDTETTPDETGKVDTDTDTVEQQATAAIATDPRLTDPNLDEDFIREELDAEYSPEVIEAIIARKRLMAPITPRTAARRRQCR